MFPYTSLFPPFSVVVFRSIYDDQPNAHKRFMEKLDARIRNHDREIEKMCNFHHQGFVDAITELLKVRADAEKLMVGAVNKMRLIAILISHIQRIFTFQNVLRFNHLH